MYEDNTVHIRVDDAEHENDTNSAPVTVDNILPRNPGSVWFKCKECDAGYELKGRLMRHIKSTNDSVKYVIIVIIVQLGRMC